MSEVEILYKVNDSNTWRDGNPMVIRPPGAYLTPEEYDAWVKGTEPPGISNLKPHVRVPHRRFINKVRYVLSGPTIKDAVMIRYGERIERAANRIAEVENASIEELREREKKLIATSFVDATSVEDLTARIENARSKVAALGRTSDAAIREKFLRGIKNWASSVVANYEMKTRSYMEDILRANDMALELGYDTNWGFDDVLTHAVILADVEPAEADDLICVPTDEQTHAWADRKKVGKRGYCIHYERILTNESVERVRDPHERVHPPRGKPSVTLAKFEPEIMEKVEWSPL